MALFYGKNLTSVIFLNDSAIGESTVTVDYEKLKKAYINSARLIKLYGETYLPIFERLHKEMEAAQARQDLRKTALELASF